MDFALDSILERDSIFIKNIGLCQLRLMNNSDFPWIILIPNVNNIIEITDLSEDQYSRLNAEILQAAKVMKDLFTPHKLNIANIGNIVSQLHVHVIARYKHDKLFPKPVWGNAYNQYAQDEAIELVNKLKIAFSS